MSDTDLHTFFECYIDVLNTREFDRLTEFLHDEVVHNGNRLSREEVVAGLRAHVAAVPDYTWRVQDTVVEGDRVAARLFNRGTPVAELFGAAPTGGSVEHAEHALHKVRDGRIHEMNFLLDVDAVRTQLGV